MQAKIFTTFLVLFVLVAIGGCGGGGGGGSGSSSASSSYGSCEVSPQHGTPTCINNVLQSNCSAGYQFNDSGSASWTAGGTCPGGGSSGGNSGGSGGGSGGGSSGSSSADLYVRNHTHFKDTGGSSGLNITINRVSWARTGNSIWSVLSRSPIVIEQDSDISIPDGSGSYYFLFEGNNIDGSHYCFKRQITFTGGLKTQWLFGTDFTKAILCGHTWEDNFE
ncbi:MAG: hypothetical protein WC073_07945 [Sterolibacterium sp.]